ncbi:MAG: hypothetical protein HRT72_02580 [Flavobacteriales bacterium]|nr:hypothetical protein [Flavobacteriales bacterium]
MTDLITIVEKEKIVAKKAVRTTSIVSVLLLLFVIVEVVFIRHTFHEKLASKNVASIVMDTAYINVPDLEAQLLVSAKELAPVLAEEFIFYALTLIHDVGPLATDNILLLADMIMDDFRIQAVPVLQERLFELYDNLYQSRDSISDPILVKSAINELLDLWEIEFQKQLDLGFNLAVDYIDDEVSILVNVPEEDLTKRQIAEKQLLACSQILFNRLSVTSE